MTGFGVTVVSGDATCFPAVSDFGGHCSFRADVLVDRVLCSLLFWSFAVKKRKKKKSKSAI